MNRKKFVFFYSGPLSQWHYSQFKDETGLTFKTAEQYMMYQKALLFSDVEIAAKIHATTQPSEQKALGRLVKGFDKSVWDKHCMAIVYKGNLMKFAQNKHLAEHLLNTQNAILVEASAEDCIWGVGLAQDDERISDPANWRGTNLLGQVLMLVRNELQS